jgi:aspartate kinase
MDVFKFGGASVKDASGIRNLLKIVAGETGNLVIVVSAFGKTTNAFENLLRAWLSHDPAWEGLARDIYYAHSSVTNDLFGESGEVKKQLDHSFSQLMGHLQNGPGGKYDFEYDQVVSFGEIWSTLIVAGYLKANNVPAEWLDVRGILLTSDRYRDADILWDESLEIVKEKFDFNRSRVFVTQGFIGGTLTGQTTTLGREGSDYTAALLGNMLDAEKVVFWKDVPGILNADPKWLKEVSKLDEISYKEAVEMTFSGAKVIHPKTIKPLHNKNIPLNVKSFLDPSEEGTVIKAEASQENIVPIFVKKENQILISLVPGDFSFVMGDNLSRVFHAFLENGIKVNLVQASAVSLDVCVDDERDKVNAVINELKTDFKAIYNDDAEMLSIRHHTPEAIEMITRDRQILLEQRTRRIARFVMKKINGDPPDV